MTIQIWAQDSKYKGLRIIRFEESGKMLQWLGSIEGVQEYDTYGRKMEAKPGHFYSPAELKENGWERLE